jgi:hypothetical protein
MLPSLPHWLEYRRRKPVLLSPFQVPASTFSSARNWLFVHVNTRPVPALFSYRPIRTFLTARLNSDWFRKLAPIPFRPISYSSPYTDFAQACPGFWLVVVLSFLLKLFLSLPLTEPAWRLTGFSASPSSSHPAHHHFLSF